MLLVVRCGVAMCSQGADYYSEVPQLAPIIDDMALKCEVESITVGQKTSGLFDSFEEFLIKIPPLGQIVVFQ